MAKRSSRISQWEDACARAQMALQDAQAAVQELVDLQQEYSDWKDNMPESLEQSPTGEKLEEVVGVDLEGALSSVEEAIGSIEEAAALDLPRGFGND